MECRVPVPQGIAPRVTWVEVSDKTSGIKAFDPRDAHPWLFFQQTEFDAATSTFSRTTSRGRGGRFTKPPKRIGTPAHEHEGKRCLISLDAWVDFEDCKPLPLFLGVLRAPNEPSAHITQLKGKKIYRKNLGHQTKARSCEEESSDVEAQLWLAFRLSRGLTWR